MASVLERLSSLDRAFFDIEEGPLHMHVGAVTVFEGGGLVRPDGGLDAAALRNYLGASLDQVPRFRQRVHFLPMLGTVWLDDPHFRLDYHVRHTAVPRPGTMDQLMSLAGRVFSQRLDRERPLWEMWLVEGLEGGRFALITKAHHAMLDGIAAVGVLTALFSLAPGAIDARQSRPPTTVTPPSRWEIARALLDQRVAELPVIGSRIADLGKPTARQRVRHALEGALQMAKDAIGRTPPTPLNPERIGPYRAFGGRRLVLEELKQIRRATNATLNDVALAVVTGALRRHLLRRGVDVEGLTLRALVPVNLRGRESASTAERAGNHVAMLVVALPVGEPDARRRMELVREHTAALKQGSHEVEAAQLAEEIGDLGPEGLISLVFNVALHMLPFHVCVTNVPGPPVPLYLGPAKLEVIFPLVPLFARQSLGVAMVSYDGGLFIGVNADLDAVPDLPAVLADLDASAAELAQAVTSR
jgi:WS/DGAT/MGAT family acyltransferase